MSIDNEYADFIKEKFPNPYNTPETYKNFILPKIQQHETLCTSVISEVQNRILQPLKEKYNYRFFCSIDSDHKTKKPISIVDKMIRSEKKNEKTKTSDEIITPDNFATTMKDLARFRVVCNFIHDVDQVVEVLKNDEALNEMFNIELKSTMELHPGKRDSAERSVKLILEYKKQPGLFLEIQVMTQLSESWDKKDHFLVYEVRRRFPNEEDENFPDYLDAKMNAMGELLYVADNYFETLRASREDIDEEKS